MSAEEIVLTKQVEDNKSDIVYIRIPAYLKKFVDQVAKDLGVKRSEAIRRLLEYVRDKGVKIE